MKKGLQFKGLKFLYIVFTIYLLLFVIDRENALLALQKVWAILYQLLPIFLLIIIVTAVINYYLKPKQIVKHFGKESGVKGVIYALLAGIISHGPMYVWYPTIQELRSHGVKDSLLLIFFYARAIKIPMIPFMIGVFGTGYTIVISLYIILFSLLQGWCMDLLNQNRSSKAKT